MTVIPLVEVKSDGMTVWVNQTAVCLGRFSANGFMVMLDGDAVYSTYRGTDVEDWETFKAQVKMLHDVDVSDQHMPARLR